MDAVWTGPGGLEAARVVVRDGGRVLVSASWRICRPIAEALRVGYGQGAGVVVELGPMYRQLVGQVADGVWFPSGDPGGAYLRAAHLAVRAGHRVERCRSCGRWHRLREDCSTADVHVPALDELGTWGLTTEDDG